MQKPCSRLLTRRSAAVGQHCEGFFPWLSLDYLRKRLSRNLSIVTSPSETELRVLERCSSELGKCLTMERVCTILGLC
jgi:hypothetical protein